MCFKNKNTCLHIRIAVSSQSDCFNVNNVVNGLAGSAAGIRIRGAASMKKYDMQAQDYSNNIEFEKISILSSIGVRFSLE